jgi:hypothetical protein
MQEILHKQKKERKNISNKEKHGKKEGKKNPQTDHIAFKALSSPNTPKIPGPNAIRVIVHPTNPNCSAVFTLLIPVGCTSALGRLKSQYRAKVLGLGREM